MATIAKALKKHAVFVAILLACACVPALIKAGILTSPDGMLIGRCIAWSMAAIGIDLIWGYAGILSLGQGLYFTLGAYAMAMYLKLQATGGRVTEFMHTGGFTELPAVWRPFNSMAFSLIACIALPALLAGLVGYLIFSKRVRGAYFSIISQALTWAAYSLLIALPAYTNGNIGITEIKSIAGAIRGEANLGRLSLLFYGSLAILALVYALCALLVSRKFGSLLIAIRDGEMRTYFSGYSVARYKTAVYALGAALAGLGGAIYVNFNASVSPTQASIASSIMMVVWVGIGGRGTLSGAVLGAFAVNIGSYRLSGGAGAEIWPYMIGAVFCLGTLFFKDGLMGLAHAKIKVPGSNKNNTKNTFNGKEEATHGDA